MRPFIAAAAIAASVVGLAVAAPAQAATPAVAVRDGAYVAVTPVRTASFVAIAPHATHSVRIAGGSTGVPVTAHASAMNVSVQPSNSAGSLVVYRNGGGRPSIATVQFASGVRTSSMAVITTNAGSAGLAQVYNNSAGKVQVSVDVVGYYARSSSIGAPKSFIPTSPTRVLNTTVNGHQTISPTLGGKGGLPGNGIGAVAVTFSEFKSVHGGQLTAGPFSQPGAPQSVLRWTGPRAGNFAIVPVDPDGQIQLTNLSSDRITLTVDAVGYFRAGAPYNAGMLNTVPTARVAHLSFAGRATHTVTLAGRGGFPLSGAATAVLSLTADGQSQGSLVAYAADQHRPSMSSMVYSGDISTTTAITQTSSSGAIKIYNNAAGSVTLSVNLVGWTLASDLDAPAATASRYLNDLTRTASHNRSVMTAHADSDAAGGARLVLLDVGAQSYHGPFLSKANPGVALALTNPTMRISYPQLVAAVQAYVDEFATQLDGDTATIAVGTNNSGNFTDDSDPGLNPIYPADVRGEDWANRVIEQVDPPAGITVVAADDIENGTPDIDGFDNSVSRAQQWEAAYLGAHPANADGSPDLIYNGSANGCPSTFGSGTSSTPCADGWKLGNFVALTRSGTRIGVLPQIYYPYMAIQWANIARVAGTIGTRAPLNFVGSLTEQSLTGSLKPGQGWAALHNAIGTLVSSPDIPYAIDIEPASAAGKRLEGLRATA